MIDKTYASRLYTEHQALWFRIAVQVVHNADDAADVVQEAYRKFLATKRHWETFEDAKRYFSAIVTTTAIDHYKLSRRELDLFPSPDSGQTLDYSGVAEWRKPEDDLERRREQHLLTESIRSIKKLPPRQRQAIEELILDEEDRSLSEVSRDLNVPISTLRSRSMAGLEKIRKILRKKRLL